MNWLWILLAVSAQSGQDAPPASYDDSFPDRYSTILTEAPTVLANMPLEEEVIVRSPVGAGVARIRRTDGAVVPYDDNIGIVTIRHGFGDDVYLLSKGFRTITVSWIGERYVHVNKGIGHIAAVEEIYDLIEQTWLVQHTVIYKWP